MAAPPGRRRGAGDETGAAGGSRLTAVVTAGSALAHTGGSNGYGIVTVERERVRYRLVLWPATLPPAAAGRRGTVSFVLLGIEHILTGWWRRSLRCRSRS